MVCCCVLHSDDEASRRGGGLTLASVARTRVVCTCLVYILASQALLTRKQNICRLGEVPAVRSDGIEQEHAGGELRLGRQAARSLIAPLCRHRHNHPLHTCLEDELWTHPFHRATRVSAMHTAPGTRGPSASRPGRRARLLIVLRLRLGPSIHRFRGEGRERKFTMACVSRSRTSTSAPRLVQLRASSARWTWSASARSGAATLARPTAATAAGSTAPEARAQTSAPPASAPRAFPAR